MKAQADVYQLAVQEEEKLKFAEIAREAESHRDKKLSYEEYFDVDASFTSSERKEQKDVRKLG